MAIRDWLIEKLTVEKLNPAQSFIASKDPYNLPETIVEYESAYREIEIVHRSIEVIVNAAVSVPLTVDGGAAKKIHKIMNAKPNPFEDRTRLFRRAILDFYLDGNAFFYYDKENGGLYLLPANDVEVVADSKTFVSHYNYLIHNTTTDYFGFGQRQTTKQEKITFTPDEIIHVKADNEDSIFRGVSRLKNLERLFELYYQMTEFQRLFFKNNAVPGLVLQTDNVLSPKVKERLLEAWRSNYSSLFKGARNPAILDGGLKIDKFSNINFTELDFENSIERIQQDIAKSIGVPYVLLKSGNNANIHANEVLFYNHTVLPLLNMFCSAFSHYFNGGVIIKPDKTSITALQPDNKTQAMYYSTLVNTGIITVNEARDGLGFETLEGDENNQIRIPQNITGSAVNPAIGGRPESSDSGTSE